MLILIQTNLAVCLVGHLTVKWSKKEIPQGYVA